MTKVTEKENIWAYFGVGIVGGGLISSVFSIDWALGVGGLITILFVGIRYIKDTKEGKEDD